MFGGTRKIPHPDTVSKLQAIGAIACLGLAGILSESWEPARATTVATAKPTVLADPAVAGDEMQIDVNQPPITPDSLLPQLSTAPSQLADRLQGADTTRVPPFSSPAPINLHASVTSAPTAIESAISDITADTTLASAKALLNTHQVFANLLQPEGFRRGDWQAFKHIKLKSDAIKQASLGPIPSITEKDEFNTDKATFTVLIDPGHGGWDPGSVAHNGLKEKILTLDIARRVELFLSEVPDINVILTRTEDVSLRRKARVQKIKEAETDLVVSIHFNHLPVPNVNLVESFYAGPEDIAESQKLMKQAKTGSGQFQHVANHAPTDLSFTRGSERLANILHKRVFNEVSLDNKKVIDAGVKTDMLYVLTQSFTPGVLMELTTISNVEEAERLTNEDYRNRLAASLVDGIRNYRESLRKNPLNGTGT